MTFCLMAQGHFKPRPPGTFLSLGEGRSSHINSFILHTPMLIFLVGMAEMVLSTLWTNYVQEKSPFGSTLVTVIHVFVWYYVLRTVLDQIDNIAIVFYYAAGCGAGTLLPMLFRESIEKRLKAFRRKRQALRFNSVQALRFNSVQARIKAAKEETIPAVQTLIAHESI